MTEDDQIKEATAKYGPPYESDGNCEICNTSGPVWMAEEPVTWNQMPLCAECLLQTPKSLS